MALILNGTTGITVTDGSNILQDGTVTTADLAAGAVTSAKMATGAAATNLGNYVQSFNGSTGAVSYTAPVTSVNGSTGAVTVQPTLVSGSNIKTINSTSLLGSGDITISSSPTTAQVTSAYAGIAAGDVGSWIWGRRAVAYSTLTWGATYSSNIQAGVYTAEGNLWDYPVSGTWRAFGAVSSDSNTKWTMWFRIA